ncbi:MAG: monovalent cation/H(+) antiporter subunit G [Rubricella sp.]
MIAEWIAAGFILSGGAFVLVAGLGVLRMPDVYIRMHASTKAGTLGLGLICVALMIIGTGIGQRLEALFVTLFMIATAPVGAHLIGRAAYRAGVGFVVGTKVEDGCEQFGEPPLAEVHYGEQGPGTPV